MEKSLKKARNSDHTKYIYFPKKLFYIIIITIIITIIMWSVGKKGLSLRQNKNILD